MVDSKLQEIKASLYPKILEEAVFLRRIMEEDSPDLDRVKGCCRFININCSRFDFSNMPEYDALIDTLYTAMRMY